MTKAHFHWFKGDPKTVKRMVQNGYYISVTPDVCMNQRFVIVSLSVEQLMVETDEPWPFEGLSQGRLTHPSMIHESIKMIADIKKLPLNDVYKQLYSNTNDFYGL